ncbi:MAG: DUF4388 domain-containing protein [Deltaproteobacteria bacterium]|nr:MAG: DUF4388 domain-containing protein [Deltaproteobacteria bacterium]
MSSRDREKTQLPVKFGKYLLVEKIATGGMAEIFKAKSYGVSGFEKTIVIKRILPAYSDDREFIDMLIDEAKICASLQHANIVQTFDLGRLQNRYYIAMEYVHGVDLASVLGRLRKAKMRLPVELCCFIMSEALNGLDYAHRSTGPDGEPLNIVHRDFNPSNILLSFLGEVKVADFGIARARRRNTKTMAGGLKGKLGYLSPEQVMEMPLDARSDIFTAGITLWEMLTCRRLFKGKNELEVLLQMRDAKVPDPRVHVTELNEQLVEIVMKALKKDREQRWRSAREFREALDDYLFERGIKVTQTHLESYLKHLFADRLEQEKQKERTAKVEKTREAPPRYWVRSPGRGTRGPVELAELIDMLSDGELPHNSQILREGETWVPLHKVPELEVHLSRLPSTEESDPNAMATYRGLLAEVSVPKLFYRLAIAKENGRLVLTRPGVKKEVYLRNGMPEFVKSNVSEEMLGEYLVAKGVITAEQRDEAVAAMRGFSGRLGDTLIGLGILQPHEMFEHLQNQVREKLLEVFSWTTGSYRFYAGQTYSGEVLPLKVGSYALIAEGVREFIPLQMLQARYRPFMDREIERIHNPYLGIEQLKLNAREQRVLDSIAEQRTLRKLLSLGGSDRQQFSEAVYRTVYLLEELEMLKIVE